MIIVIGAGLSLVLPNAHLLGRINGAYAILVCLLLPSVFFLLARYKLKKSKRITSTPFETAFVCFLIACCVVGLGFYLVIMTFQREQFDCVLAYQYAELSHFIERRPANYTRAQDPTLHPIGIEKYCDTTGWNVSEIYLF